MSHSPRKMMPVQLPSTPDAKHKSQPTQRDRARTPFSTVRQWRTKTGQGSLEISWWSLRRQGFLHVIAAIYAGTCGGRYTLPELERSGLAMPSVTVSALGIIHATHVTSMERRETFTRSARPNPAQRRWRRRCDVPPINQGIWNWNSPLIGVLPDFGPAGSGIFRG
jgi:hypothetical protein